MKKAIFILTMGLLLASCNTSSFPVPGLNPTAHTVIDWVDFIETENGHYQASFTATIADPKLIGKKIAEVDFKIADVVSDPSYKIKPGDAAFWEAGTEVFEVEGRPELAAVPDVAAINGYRIYYTDSVEVEFKEHFKDFDFTEVDKIEIYKGFDPPVLLNTLTDDDQINDFFSLLEDQAPNSTFAVDPKQPDPIFHQMVFYDEDQLARKFQLDFDNNQWVWYPWDREVLPDAIGSYVEP